MDDGDLCSGGGFNTSPLHGGALALAGSLLTISRPQPVRRNVAGVGVTGTGVAASC